jgi:hypothetical protein
VRQAQQTAQNMKWTDFSFILLYVEHDPFYFFYLFISMYKVWHQMRGMDKKKKKKTLSKFDSDFFDITL